MPLLFATGAGASARKTIGMAVSSGTLAATFRGVLFVASFLGARRGEERCAKKSDAGKAAGGRAPDIRRA
jgi:hydrophobic/amphiphilic exporter-1 (mainly G- bacteria), HAE1 family